MNENSTATETASAGSAPAGPVGRRAGWLLGGGLLGLLLVIHVALMWWWSFEPARFDPAVLAEHRAQEDEQALVPGATLLLTAEHLAGVLLDKPGGYLANDLLPPGRLLDNLPNWEFGVILQLRDLSLALRNDFSRSQSQSIEDPDLREALNMFSSEHRKWIFPSTESRLREGIEKLRSFRRRLTDADQHDAQFFVRADNLEAYLGLVEKRLGSLSQRLSASVGQQRVNIDLAGDAAATQATPTASEQMVRTPWLQIDDVFYEARGSTWALLHILKAIEHDFAPVLANKNAGPSLRQIIRELEEAQAPLRSPVVLNGRPFGFFANHSLVMANYVARANAAIIDLRQLLRQG